MEKLNGTSMDFTQEKVKKLSGMEDLVLRPLSAKLLPPSRAELMGWVDREKLLDINGRSRQRQMELMEYYGLVELQQLLI